MSIPNSIIFCGLDGCGKTTQAKNLLNYFIKCNVESNYVWLRYPFRLIIPFVIFLRFFKLSAYPRTIQKKNNGIKNLQDHKFLSFLWEKLLFYDLKIDYYFKVKKPIDSNKIIILDRSIIDTVVDLVLVTGNTKKLEYFLKKFSTLLPPSRQMILLDITPELSFERNKDEDLEQLIIRRDLYHKICQINNLKIIDGTQNVDDIHQQILTLIKS